MALRGQGKRIGPSEASGKKRFGGALLVLMGLVFVTYGPVGFAYASRLAGTPGTFTVVYCSQVASGRGSNTVCDGTFRSADRRITDDRAELVNDVDGSMLDVQVPVTRRGTEDYYMARPGYAAGWLCMAFAGVLLLACGIPAVWTGQTLRADRPRHPRLARAATLTARTALTCVGVCGATALVLAVW